MGTYRAQLKATDRLGVRMATRIGGAGGYLHWHKYRERKKPMPIAIVIGCAPVVIFTGPQKLPIDLDEMAVAGGLAGAPIRIVKCVTVDLEVPADAEIVIEGLIDPELLEPEGPFGESHGHVALEDFNMSMQVTAITHKRSPVFVSIVSQVTPSESSVIKNVAYEPRFLAHLRDQLGIKGVRRVVMHEPLTNLRPVIFVQFAHGTPRTEIWRGAARRRDPAGRLRQDRHRGERGHRSAQHRRGVLVAGLSRQSDRGRAHRAVPAGGHGPKSGPARSEEFDAADRRHAEDPMPPLALPKREFMERARKIWDELGLPALKPQPPWHGYSLGDWDAAGVNVPCRVPVAQRIAVPRRLRRERRQAEFVPDRARALHVFALGQRERRHRLLQRRVDQHASSLAAPADFGP